MSGFKLLALRTGRFEISPTTFLKTKSSNTNVNWLKNLSENTVYPFSSDYNYPNNDFNLIKKNHESPDIFSLILGNKKKLPINVHSVVGENGSGKSTLIELIYWMNYNLGTINNHLKSDNGEDYEINKSFNTEIFYLADSIHYILNFENGGIQQTEVNFINDKYQKPVEFEFKSIWQFKDIQNFFYTVVINYSQHSLNALDIGDWIDPLFHKNDAYQTPIVINPQRNNGNLNVNKEKLLLSRRLQSLVLESYDGIIEDSLRNLVNGKIAVKFDVSYNQKYFEKNSILLKSLTFKTFKKIADLLVEIFNIDFSFDDLNLIYHYNTNIKERQDFFDDKTIIFKKIILDYIFCKMKKLVKNYIDYKNYSANFPSQIKKILIKVRNSDSHLVFKLKGAILHLKYYEEIYQLNNLKSFTDSFYIDIDVFSQLIHSKIIPNEKDLFYVNTFMMSMPSFWNVEIIPKENNLIGQFSSGEKQRINSISSIIYHLVNLNSVEENKKIKEYKFINLVLDEIELYFHPEWQRRFLDDLISNISKINPLNLKNIEGINILFVTHSPFILSDIPSSNILRLKSGVPEPVIPQTFGANIHDLLANDFFLHNGFMGEFAKGKINKVINSLKMIQILKDGELNGEKITNDEAKLKFIKKQKGFESILKLEILSEDDCKNIINLIGEPMLYMSLMELFSETFKGEKDLFIDEQIKKLESLKSK